MEGGDHFGSFHPHPFDALPPVLHPPLTLRIDDISYSIQDRPLFDGATAAIPEGHKVCLARPIRTTNPTP
ncbi:hypothetical protein [Paracoccus shandongensis]|uniref:hypothetical protein n=1 Tax=Paracoccus shandongensis TaxID=2816048 RepID=UPI001A907457|nr:hypothetical protein [Paracoccus shandongensis]